VLTIQSVFEGEKIASAVLILQAAFPPFFVCGGLFVKTSFSTDPRSLLCKRRVLGFLSSAICQFR